MPKRFLLGRDGTAGQAWSGRQASAKTIADDMILSMALSALLLKSKTPVQEPVDVNSTRLKLR